MDSIFNIVMLFLAIVLASAIALVTLSLNTKSEGLGAAITGASDNYRGAVGVEEQKRRLLQNLNYSFMALALVYMIVIDYL
jgi:preprotein translocase subunit SecG